MRYFLSIIFLLVNVVFAKATTTITCNNKEYAGKTIDFYSYSDPVTKDKIPAFNLVFDNNGKCTASINVSKNTFVFSDFGVYRGMLFLEPNQNMALKLPPFREKTFADQKNPYFEPVSFWFATENENQLSNQISEFTIKLNQLTGKYFDRLYFRQSRNIFDSIANELETEFSGIRSDAFTTYKKLSLKIIEVEAFREKPEEYAQLFSEIKPEYWLQPSFISLFDNTFNSQLSFAAKSVKGDNIRNAVNKSDIGFLTNFVKSQYKVDGESGQLILLKLLHDAWYSGDFSKPAIEKMVNSASFTKSKNEIIRQSADNIYDRFTFLQPGNEAPVICLNDLEGKKICTNQNNSKFKYLIFADTEMIVCREHLKYLGKIQERFQKYLEIYVILRNTNPTDIKKFFTENEVPGAKLIDANNEFIEKYRIKSFPQCFLLDENHKVKFTSAKAPLDGFEQQFGTFLQHELFERQRNQKR